MVKKLFILYNEMNIEEIPTVSFYSQKKTTVYLW